MILTTLPPTVYVSTVMSPVRAREFTIAKVENGFANAGSSTPIRGASVPADQWSLDSFPMMLQTSPLSTSYLVLFRNLNNPLGNENHATLQGMHRLKRISSLQQEIVSFVGDRWSVAPETARQARRMVAYLPVNLPLPQVKPSDEGEIGLFWISKSNRVEAVFMPEENRLVWIGKFAGKFVPGGDVPWGGPIPTDLLAMLDRLHG